MIKAIYIEITSAKGSTPRDPGTAMKVTEVGILGTIGGGVLEHAAISEARRMLANDLESLTQTIPLGPNLGQCCGGSVTLHFSSEPRPLDVNRSVPALAASAPSGPVRSLWIWGAGHVGRAIVRQAVPTASFDITWVDSSRGRFPDPLPAHITPLPVSDMPRVMPYAPKDAVHLILTYSHEIDLALCAAALNHGFAFCGLIGSTTKWTRFSKRLRAMGLDPTSITCPIGDPSLGKHPDQIAAGTLRALLSHQQQKETA